MILQGHMFALFSVCTNVLHALSGFLRLIIVHYFPVVFKILRRSDNFDTSPGKGYKRNSWEIVLHLLICEQILLKSIDFVMFHSRTIHVFSAFNYWFFIIVKYDLDQLDTRVRAIYKSLTLLLCNKTRPFYFQVLKF
jgi:hypothetical protein